MTTCEGYNFNDSEYNVTESFESSRIEKEIDTCWVHCRELFKECFDNCKLICVVKNCTSTLQELILPLPPLQDSSSVKTVNTVSGRSNNGKENK